MIAWVNGAFVDPKDPAIPVTDHGLTVGDGVFESLKVVDAIPFALTRHLVRLRNSAAGLGLECPAEDLLRAAVDAVLAADPAAGRLRVTVTGGPAPMGSDRGGAGPTVIVVSGPASTWPATTALQTVPWPRNERSALAGLKTTSYAENVIALDYAHRRDAGEALFLDTTGRVCEGTGSNLFAVIGGRLVTPDLTTGCLDGVTRRLVVEWCGAAEETLLPADLLAASEVFITSSTRDVQPVDRIDARVVPAPGTITLEVAAEFARRSGADPDP